MFGNSNTTQNVFDRIQNSGGGTTETEGGDASGLRSCVTVECSRVYWCLRSYCVFFPRETSFQP